MEKTSEGKKERTGTGKVKLPGKKETVKIIKTFLLSLAFTISLYFSHFIRSLGTGGLSAGNLSAAMTGPCDIADAITVSVFAAVIAAAAKLKKGTPKKLRSGYEYGSARWGNDQDLAGIKGTPPFHDMILTATESISISSLLRNKNVLVLGGSGSGKSRSFAAPNILQMNSSYVVTDPKCELLRNTGAVLSAGHYSIRFFNTTDFSSSMHYNPFKYIQSEKDILSFVDILMANTKGEGRDGDDFWVKAERLLYCALIGYIYYEYIPVYRNFSALLNLLDGMEASENDENLVSAVDMLFNELEETDPDHFAVRQYRKYKKAAGKTAKSILISCGARLAPFDIGEVREITEYDELCLDKLGDEKSALFLIMSDNDQSFNFLIAICTSQLFTILSRKADTEKDGALKYHVSCIIDECANIGRIPNLEKLMATIRSRNISAALILQTVSQLKAVYKDHAETIIGNCDSRLFLGGTEPGTLKLISESLGRETIDVLSTGENRQRETSKSTNCSKMGKALMTQDELSMMDGKKCILQIRGIHPFFSCKYDLLKHPGYKETGWYSENNLFDPKKYMNTHIPEENLTRHGKCSIIYVDENQT